jgi:hypothetical protein
MRDSLPHGLADNVSADRVLATLIELRGAIDELGSRLDGSTKELLTIEEIARLTARAPYTIRRWVKEGLIDAIRLAGSGPRGRLLVPRAEIRKLVVLGRGGHVPGFELSEPTRATTPPRS